MIEEELRFIFARQLRRLLVNVHNISHKELSIRSGVSEDTLTRYTQMRSTPTCENVVRICKALGCTPYELLNDIIF